MCGGLDRRAAARRLARRASPRVHASPCLALPQVGLGEVLPLPWKEPSTEAVNAMAYATRLPSRVVLARRAACRKVACVRRKSVERRASVTSTVSSIFTRSRLGWFIVADEVPSRAQP